MQKLVPTGLRLEPEVLEKLRQSDRGLSDEIRARLERTFQEDDAPKLRELRDALFNLADLVRADFGEWHSSPAAHKEFVAAVMQRLAGYAPPVPPPSGTATVSDLFEAEGMTADPEMLGKVREQDDRRWHTYPHLAAAQRRATSRTGALGRAMRAKKGDDRS